MDYIFYKLYRVSQRSSIPEIAGLLAELIFTICLSFNVLSFIVLLNKMSIIEYYPSKSSFILISVGIFIITSMLFFINSRYKHIVEKYKIESDMARSIGNLFVGVYVVLSFAFLLVIAFYRPEIF
ncbi:hypothetical protein ACT3CE_13515 [Marinifilum sp. RC60d5]|uniref:hypothetical protein n=1 Tax=Marinifilum sp. RC60d5 TaxID=3458414 RepID=UPI004036207A